MLTSTIRSHSSRWRFFTNDSGITPALSPACAEATEDAIREARNAGLFVSYDLNYRANLWSPEQARETTERFIENVDMCIGNEEDAAKVLGISESAASTRYVRAIQRLRQALEGKS